MKYRTFKFLTVMGLTAIFQSSCSFSLFGIGWGDGDGPGEESADKNSAESQSEAKKESLEGEIDIDIDHQVSIENMELKQARIWSRLDELEGTLLKQKEKIKILERGLHLGIGPDKIKKSKPVENQHPNQAMLRPTVKSLGILKSKKTDTEKKNKDERDQKHIAEVYQARLMMARDFFRQGKYGKAYLEFSRMGKEFEASTHHGEPGYWTGRCWYQLKEYSQAAQYLSGFITKYGKSPHLASAKFYLAKTELAMGMREKAIGHLQSLIKDHPYEGSSEAARQLLSHMTRDL